MGVLEFSLELVRCLLGVEPHWESSSRPVIPLGGCPTYRTERFT